MKWNTAVILSWGLIYIACSVLTPHIGLGVLFLSIYGVLMIAPLTFEGKHRTISNIMFFIFGCAEAVGGVASWTGLLTWNLNTYNNQALYQTTMALMDFIGSIALFTKVEKA